MNDDRFVIVREDLHRRYGQAFDAQTIDGVLDKTIAERNESSRMQTYMPVFVEREASERLCALAAERDLRHLRRQEILYVDERNAGRSQLAAAITLWLAGESVVFRSVGLNPVGGIDPNVLKVLGERGIRHDMLYQKEIVPRTVHRSDIVVLMGVDSIPGIPGDRYIHWDIDDPAGQPIEKVREIADQVEAHVRPLLEELGVTVAHAA
ncbi:low molecular weight phosphatase family protein [Corynebacterium halotolerans]|uniref:Protein-tyrosine phosphatase low molecular weight n=1 Tax=Corynebacterium halotolerans YIM 70093 = DSM 44683 TaxID=1121362 RepID=M1NVX7_9CORY|nr:protein-tyrosine-phosphatase [Corynebacterium halotolerans]AGF73627.1 protein-tyrosine phosphatase low molecular weight [Corynebacterium halotolerans YIM 70093 = DSM 44683]